MRFLLYLLWFLISLLVIVLVSVTLLLTVYNDEIEHKLVSGIANFTKHEIEIQGDLGFHFNPWPTFVAKDIKMANSSWSHEPWMLEVESLSVSLAYSDLLRGEINLKQVHADHPVVLIESDLDSNDINWLFKSGREPRPLKFMAEHFRVQNASIDNAEVIIRVGRIPHVLKLNTVNGEADYFSRIADIKAIGLLDNEPLDLDIRLDSLRSMFLREPSYISFDGDHGPTQIQGNGKIDDLLSWQGHEIKLNIQTPTLKAVQSWVETRLIDTPALSASADFIQPGRWASARFDDIRVNSEALDGSSRIHGSITKLKGLSGIDLHGEMAYPLASVMRWKGKQSVTDAHLQARLRLYGNKQEALKFEIEAASLKGQGIDLRSAGLIESLLQPDTEGIPVSGTVDSVALIGQFTAQKWFETGPLQGGFEIRKKAGRLALEKVDVLGFEQRANLRGMLDDITDTQQGVFQFSAKLLPADVKLLNDLNKLNLSVFQNTSIEATVDMQRTDFSAPEFRMELNSPGVQFTTDGEVSDLKTLRTRAAEITLEADNVTSINQQFSIDLPELGRLKATGIATGDISNTYNINNIQGTLKNKHQTYSALGSIISAGENMQTDLAVTSEIRSVDNILLLLESDINIPGTLHASGRARLISQSATDWSAERILVKLDGENQGSVTGSVRHFPQASDYNLVAELRRVNVEGLIDLDAVRTLKPENASVYMEIRKAGDDDTFSLNNIDGEFGLASGEASLKLAGDVRDIIQLEGISLTLGLSARELRAVPYLALIPFRAGIGGVASMQLLGNTEALDISISNMIMADSDAQGQLNLKLPRDDRKLYISGQLNSKNFDILALLERDKSERLFSDAQLELDWVNNLDADLKLHGERVNGLITQLNNASLSISIKDGILNAPDFNGSPGEGYLSTWVTIDTNNKPYDMVIAILGKKISPENVNLFGDTEIIRGGQIDVDVGLAGSGTSVAHFMSNAYGKILLELHNSSVKNQNLELIGADIATSILNVISPDSRGSAEYLPIECGVIHFPVTNGDAIASQGIAIKTDDVTVLGGGVIDFKQEMLELIIRPKARKGLGFSVGTVANIAKISGPFEDTSIALDRSALLQSTAAIGVAIASGGWSLLAQGLLDRNLANSDVCTQTLMEPHKPFFTQVEDAFTDISKER